MSDFNQEGFDRFMTERGVVGIKEQPFELASKRKSHWYVNWRPSSGDLSAARKVAGYAMDFVEDHKMNPDCFYGVPEGATPWAFIFNIEMGRRDVLGEGEYTLPFGRSTPKSHGDPANRYFVTPPKGRTILVEDVTTTGSSLVKQLGYLLQYEPVEVVGVLALTNRMELTPIPEKDDPQIVAAYLETFNEATGKEYPGPMGVEDIVRKMGIKHYHALSDGPSILPKVIRKMEKPPARRILEEIEQEFEEYGVKPIDLLAKVA